MNRRLKKDFLLGVILLLIPWISKAQRMPAYLELVHADSMEYNKIGNVEVTQIFGNVFFRKGARELRCEQVIYYHRSERTVFRQNVTFSDSGRFLSADEVEYFARPERENARGRVHLIVDEKDIRARRLSYDVEREYAIAEDDVSFFDRKNHVKLFGGRITYDRNNELGVAEIQPRLVQLDSLGRETLTIQAVRLRYDGQRKQAFAEDSVRIQQKDALAFARQATYFQKEERVVISGEPRVIQHHDHLSADTLELFLKEDRLQHALLKHNATMVSRFLVENQPAEDRVTGQQIWIDFENDSLRRIQVTEQAISVYHVIDDDQVQGVNQVMGDELELLFESGKVRNVWIRSKPGLSRGLFTPAGKPVKPLDWTK